MNNIILDWVIAWTGSIILGFVCGTVLSRNTRKKFKYLRDLNAHLSDRLNDQSLRLTKLEIAVTNIQHPEKIYAKSLRMDLPQPRRDEGENKNG